MFMWGYDWRLHFENIEVRDAGLTKLKMMIEMAKSVQRERVVLLAHSMGSPLLFYFFKWVESPLGGNGGPNWVNDHDHVHAFINIGGAFLGAPKSVSALFSGEMRDTAHLGPLQGYLVDSLISKVQRRELFHSWRSLGALMPRGGNAIWGNLTHAPDDSTNGLMTNGRMFRFDHNNTYLTMDEVLNLLMSVPILKQSLSKYSFGSKFEPYMENNPSYWSNPLESPLPNAPDMTVYCLYGVGKSTERAYHYNHDGSAQGEVINYEVFNSTARVFSGVQDVDGDGTIPLISLGYMCVKGWPDNDVLNPGRSPVVTKEYQHHPASLNIRGGHSTGDHVDIMGNRQLSSPTFYTWSRITSTTFKAPFCLICPAW
ncbi:phospholipid:diacylglycerol acyltransferase [Pelomyxa schiedti]|nr:phospholipid:diacylglycerol acyltransferase [Pelomyxa schiedti]